MDWAVRLRVRFASRLARNWLGLNRPRSAKATRQVWLKPEPGLDDGNLNFCCQRIFAFPDAANVYLISPLSGLQ